MTQITLEQMARVLGVVAGVVETVRNHSPVRSDTLYEVVADYGITFQQYEMILDALAGIGLIRLEPGHLLVRTGPPIVAATLGATSPGAGLESN